MSYKITRLLVLTLIISSSLTFGFLILNNSKKIFKKDIFYKVYDYNTDPFVNVIDSQFPIVSFKESFEVFSDLLNTSILDLNNPCGELKSGKDKLSVMVVQDPYNDLRISIYGDNLDLMDKCKSFIDDEINIKNENVKKLYTTLYMIIMDMPRPGMKNKYRFLDPSTTDDFYMVKFKRETIGEVEALSVAEIFISVIFITFISLFAIFLLFSNKGRSTIKKGIKNLDKLIS